MEDFPEPKILQKSIEHLCLELFLMWEKSEVVITLLLFI
jgi:hypothetical protein